tara:strand:+ start:304 stop:843 length:540 start_codon:yes stop_codon:yes gene_type:complete
MTKSYKLIKEGFDKALQVLSEQETLNSLIKQRNHQKQQLKKSEAALELAKDNYEGFWAEIMENTPLRSDILQSIDKYGRPGQDPVFNPIDTSKMKGSALTKKDRKGKKIVGYVDRILLPGYYALGDIRQSKEVKQEYIKLGRNVVNKSVMVSVRKNLLREVEAKLRKIGYEEPGADQGK